MGRPTMSASSARASPECGAAGTLGVSSIVGALCITGLVAGMAAGMLAVGMPAGGAELFLGAATSHSSVCFCVQHPCCCMVVLIVFSSGLILYRLFLVSSLYRWVFACSMLIAAA